MSADHDAMWRLLDPQYEAPEPHDDDYDPTDDIDVEWAVKQAELRYERDLQRLRDH